MVVVVFVKMRVSNVCKSTCELCYLSAEQTMGLEVGHDDSRTMIKHVHGVEAIWGLLVGAWRDGSCTVWMWMADVNNTTTPALLRSPANARIALAQLFFTTTASHRDVQLTWTRRVSAVYSQPFATRVYLHQPSDLIAAAHKHQAQNGGRP